MDIILAAVDGSDMVRQLLIMLVIGICVLAIWFVGKWFIGKFGGPPLAMTFWNGLFVLLGLFVAVNFLLSLIGYPLVSWPRR